MKLAESVLGVSFQCLAKGVMLCKDGKSLRRGWQTEHGTSRRHVLETKDLAFAMIADKVLPIRSSVVVDWSGGEVGGRRPRKQ